MGSNFTDPMIRVAAEVGGLSADTLRWLHYADRELTRLRVILDLPTQPPYAVDGRPQYVA